jgi:hypothetical protein
MQANNVSECSSTEYICTLDIENGGQGKIVSEIESSMDSPLPKLKMVPKVFKTFFIFVPSI